MTRLLGLNVLAKQRGFLYLCITTGFSRSLAGTFIAKATVIRSFAFLTPHTSVVVVRVRSGCKKKSLKCASFPFQIMYMYLTKKSYVQMCYVCACALIKSLTVCL